MGSWKQHETAHEALTQILTWRGMSPAREAMAAPTAQDEWQTLSDMELVRAYREHQVDQAFATLVRRYHVRLFRVLTGILGGDKHLAEELCQRTLIKAALNIEQLRQEQAFYGWLLKVARGTAIDELRSLERRRRREEPAPAGVQAPDPTAAIATKDAVARVLGSMDPDDRLVLVLADLEKHTMSELADVLDCKESAAKMRLKRARERFKHIYSEMSA